MKAGVQFEIVQLRNGMSVCVCAVSHRPFWCVWLIAKNLQNWPLSLRGASTLSSSTARSAVMDYEALNQCERNPQCTRGFKHGGECRPRTLQIFLRASLLTSLVRVAAIKCFSRCRLGRALLHRQIYKDGETGARTRQCAGSRRQWARQRQPPSSASQQR